MVFMGFDVFSVFFVFVLFFVFFMVFMVLKVWMVLMFMVVLIVYNWSDVNQELLDKTIEEFKTRTFDYEKLSLKYWVDKIKLIN